tara:strand:+ start:2563 stop:3087 length:525 start_codon:yes stop_codon:yes gene_type:complete
MAITGTKVASSSGTKKPYFINKCYVIAAEQTESQYSDTTVKLELEDSDNGYKYTVFMNQSFDKDANDVVTGLKYPDLVNTLYLAAGKDLNVTDTGEVNLTELANAQVACLSYPSTGKYKRAIWSTVSSWDNIEDLGKKFEAQLAKGYPKNYRKEEAKETVAAVTKPVDLDNLPF